jgi:hypothetical protein
VPETPPRVATRERMISTRFRYLVCWRGVRGIAKSHYRVM